MKNDYLWDGSGEPDRRVLELEKSLAVFRHQDGAPDFLRKGSLDTAHRRESPRPEWQPRLAAAAALLLATGVGISLLRVKPTAVLPAGWDVARVAGAPHLGRDGIRMAGGKARLEVGQVLETDGRSRASVTVAEIGQVEVEPNTRVRLVETGRSRKRIALERGTIHAAIWAPPGEFVVDTPSAVAVDLGCAYTLEVDEEGSGTLRTTLGWVGFEREGRESFIPAGAMCATRASRGPGTPYFEDATLKFRAALYQLDFAALTPEGKTAALRLLLGEARARDGLTLWHLLSRVNGDERERVYLRLASLVPPPGGVTRDGVRQLDEKSLDAWWGALGLGDIGIWRRWEQSWSREPR